MVFPRLTLCIPFNIGHVNVQSWTWYGKPVLKKQIVFNPMLIIIIVWLIRYLCLCNQSTGTLGIIFGIYLQYFSGIKKFLAYLVEDKEIPSEVEEMDWRNRIPFQ